MVLESIKNFFGYWYFRYLLVTELYMVEKWERAMFHVIFFTFLVVLYLFNTTIVLGLVKLLIDMISTKGGGVRHLEPLDRTYST